MYQSTNQKPHSLGHADGQHARMASHKGANIITLASPSRVQLSEGFSLVWGFGSFPVVMASSSGPAGGTTAICRGSTDTGDTLARTAFVMQLRCSTLVLDTSLSSSLVLSRHLLQRWYWHCKVRSIHELIIVHALHSRARAYYVRNINSYWHDLATQ